MEWMSADEDVRMFNEYISKVKSLGYEIKENADYDFLQYLQHRLPKSLETEDTMIQSDLEKKIVDLKEDLSKLRDGCATLLQETNQDTMAENSNLTSADLTLGRDISNKVRNWVMESVLADPRCSVEQIFKEFMRFYEYDAGIRRVETPIMRYIMTLREMYVQISQNETANVTKFSQLRNRLASQFISCETNAIKSILNRKQRVFIRQIFNHGDDLYYVKCPVCGKHIQVTENVAMFIAYGVERGVQHRLYPNAIVCDDCDTAIMFKSDEYNIIQKSFLKQCRESIDSFISVSKKECTGASIVHVGLPITAFREDFPDLFVLDSTNESDMRGDGCESEKKIIPIVSEDEMQEAARNFYMKLLGISSVAVMGRARNDRQFTSQSEQQYQSELHTSGTVLQSNDWTIHDSAVMITQCLSKDYYEEQNKALFSLVSFITLNPYLADTLSRTIYWDIENSLSFINKYVKLKNYNLLNSNELACIRNALQYLNVVVPNDCEQLMQLAKESVPKLKELLESKRDEYYAVINDLQVYEDQLARVPINKISSCKLLDLVDLMSEVQVAELFARVVDKMIIYSYADEYCDYWKAYSGLRGSRVDNICDFKAQGTEVEKSLQKLCNDGWFSKTALSRMQLMYDRPDDLAEYLQRLNRSFVNADYYQFCQCVIDVLALDFTGSGNNVMAELRGLYTKFGKKAEQVLRDGKAVTMLGRDFTADEVKQCDECNNLLFGRYVLKRLPNESIFEYCNRYSVWDGSLSGDVSVWDNYQLFADVNGFGVFLSVCATVFAADYRSFGKNIFMSCILEDVKDSTGAEFILKVSQMQQNIVKLVNSNICMIEDGDSLYRLLSGVYLSGAGQEVSALYDNFSSTVIRVSDTFQSVIRQCNLREYVTKIYDAAESFVSDDGETIQDGMTAIEEMSVYLHRLVNDTMELIG